MAFKPMVTPIKSLRGLIVSFPLISLVSLRNRNPALIGKLKSK